MNSSEKILVINSGSSSLKLTLYAISTKQRLASGLVERIGTESANMVYSRSGEPKTEKTVVADNHAAALEILTKCLVDPKLGVMDSLAEIGAIGHRVLHGGEIFKEATMVTADVMTQLRYLVPLGPLHMPANIGGVEACKKIFPDAPNVAVFDTAFHQTMPDYASHYAIPNEYYEKYGIRKFGFHGTSHHYVTLATAEFLGKKPEELKLVTCHLGNGSSLAAVKYGKVYDTTMGLTPLDGVVMGTRSGNLDPAVVLTLVRQGMTADEIDNLLNKKSGLLGVGGINSGDMRDIVNNAANGVETAKLALDMWIHRIIFYIGGYSALIGGADAIVFTGGIGENSWQARSRVISQLGSIGCTMDEDANRTRRGPCFVSTADSRVAAIIMPTDEELMIARQTFEVVTAARAASRKHEEIKDFAI